VEEGRVLFSAASAERLFMAVAAAAHEPGLEVSNLSPGRVVVVIVEMLDDLERPPAREHIPADDVAPPRRRVLAVAAGGETRLISARVGCRRGAGRRTLSSCHREMTWAAGVSALPAEALLAVAERLVVPIMPGSRCFAITATAGG
jgi:hypothetical protein